MWDFQMDFLLDDTFFMEAALLQAKKAALKDEVPIGCVIVQGGDTIIARAYNRTEQNNSQIYHAEIIALAQAGKKIGDWRLTGCRIYVTLKPCVMCFSAILLSRIDGIVFGADSPLFGYRLDKQVTSSIYNDRLFKRALSSLSIREGVCADQARLLLQDFFKKKRSSGGQS